MSAIDTNVLLRLILHDDPAQTELAARILAEPVLLGLGVLMEAAWVLRSSYGQPRAAIAEALTTVLDIGTVHTPDDTGVRWAIDRYGRHGADLADMLHLVASKGSEVFLSFDQRLPRQAGPDCPVRIELL